MAGSTFVFAGGVLAGEARPHITSEQKSAPNNGRSGKFFCSWINGFLPPSSKERLGEENREGEEGHKEAETGKGRQRRRRRRKKETLPESGESRDPRRNYFVCTVNGLGKWQTGVLYFWLLGLAGKERHGPLRVPENLFEGRERAHD